MDPKWRAQIQLSASWYPAPTIKGAVYCAAVVSGAANWEPVKFQNVVVVVVVVVVVIVVVDFVQLFAALSFPNATSVRLLHLPVPDHCYS
jgi:hypothetical protein